jgi:7-cyano-7-deazaguanine synthase
MGSPMGKKLTAEPQGGAVVLFSGGQDSSTALAWALERYNRVETIAYDYGQKHAIELECRQLLRTSIGRLLPSWSERLGPDHIVQMDLIGRISGKTITEYPGAFPRQIEQAFGAAYIPGRNMILLAMSASVAFRRKLDILTSGVSETEFSGYPDCRDASMRLIEQTINACSDLTFEIVCPLMTLKKAEVWSLALRLGGRDLVEIIRVQSHTCYIGQRNSLHDWGYGCGECAACALRAKGWKEFVEKHGYERH